MPATDVTTSAVALDLSGLPDIGPTGQTLVIQNLGPDDLYVDFDEDVAEDNGIKLPANIVWEVPGYVRSRPVYVVSSGESDVRYTVVS